MLFCNQSLKFYILKSLRCFEEYQYSKVNNTPDKIEKKKAKPTTLRQKGGPFKLIFHKSFSSINLRILFAVCPESYLYLAQRLLICSPAREVGTPFGWRQSRPRRHVQLRQGRLFGEGRLFTG